MAMADLFERALGSISGGRVLDVATAEGGFVGLLKDKLAGYAHISGVDADPRSLVIARKNHPGDEVHFFQMDARRLGFAAGSFDTVAISASLHHLNHIPPVLAEMERVLRPGGHFVLAEMHCDGQKAAQSAVVAIHHWIAAIDLAQGKLHNPTLARQEIVDYVQDLGLRNLVFHDSVDSEADPMDGEFIAHLEKTIEDRIQRAGGMPGTTGLKHRGEELRQQIRGVGAQREPVIVIVGQK
jgi:ubiquinone/menaquinone biosynthesis C-methylase UbiE